MQRASPLSADRRREMIIDSVIPLLVGHGRQVTTKQIAESAGVAEGTIFRAFGDKESLVKAAIEKRLDPTELQQSLADIDPALPLERKVHRIVEVMQRRFHEVFAFMAAVGEVGRPPASNSRQELTTLIERVLRPDLERLNLPPARAAQFIRLVTLASSIPHSSTVETFDAHDLSALILSGISGHPGQSPTQH